MDTTLTYRPEERPIRRPARKPTRRPYYVHVVGAPLSGWYMIATSPEGAARKALNCPALRGMPSVVVGGSCRFDPPTTYYRSTITTEPDR